MWCNMPKFSNPVAKAGFNAARSIICGATRKTSLRLSGSKVSMPHAAFYVVQPPQLQQRLSGARFQCRTQHFMWCNGKVEGVDAVCEKFQCRTQHFMWCNCEYATGKFWFDVSMPHAAFYVVQPNMSSGWYTTMGFQCRTQHFMWCNQ